MIATVVIAALVMFPALLGIRSLIKVFRGTEKCECSGDCGKCRIKCRSNPNFYGIQRADREGQ